MYDTSPHSPLKGEVRQLWPEDISTKELESWFDLDPALEESLDFSELDSNNNPAEATPVVPDSAAVTQVPAGGCVDLLTLTAAVTTEHLAQLEGQVPIFTANHGAAVATAASSASQPLQTSPAPSLTAGDGVGSAAINQDVLMPEYPSLVAMTSPANTATPKEGGVDWGQAPYFSTVKTEDLSTLTACSLEASLPGFTPSTTTAVCKMESFTQDDSCSQFMNLSPRSTRSMSESSTATSTVPDSPRPSGKGRSKRRQVPKDSNEYKEKRARNNIAVRKSRAKAKEKQRMTEDRVKELMEVNENLQKRLEMLTKEVTVLKGLFINVGASLPDDFSKLMEAS
ncbi:uncharacterized protein LOC143286076 [Babylonia areolata]|uniref:uncharacterized protein LOC143286076 n=1 Tax=Babylonia areolata TaxID=304850 RepID=UPI003FD5202F